MKGIRRNQCVVFTLMCFGLTIWLALYSNDSYQYHISVQSPFRVERREEGAPQEIEGDVEIFIRKYGNTTVLLEGNDTGLEHITNASRLLPNLKVKSVELCTGRNGHKSVKSANKVILNFINTKSVGINLWWVNLLGVEVKVAQVLAGSDKAVLTFSAHVWVVRNSLTLEQYLINGSCVYVTSSSSIQHVLIQDPGMTGINPSGIRLLCWILCDVGDLDRRVRHVKNTWAKRCDITLYMASKENHEFPTIGLNVSSGRNHIASKSKAAWKYIYANHFHDADFFMKADPDTFAVVENIKDFLSTKNTSVPEFYGHRFFVKGWKHPYMSGGPGLILTKESLRRLVVTAFNSESNCMPDGQGEDYKTAGCLYSVGAKAVDCRDEQGRDRFIVFNPTAGLDPYGHYPAWYNDRDMGLKKVGPGCCSDYPLSFHYIRPLEMYVLDYFLYRARIAGDR